MNAASSFTLSYWTASGILKIESTDDNDVSKFTNYLNESCVMRLMTIST